MNIQATGFLSVTIIPHHPRIETLKIRHNDSILVRYGIISFGTVCYGKYCGDH